MVHRKFFGIFHSYLRPITNRQICRWEFEYFNGNFVKTMRQVFLIVRKVEGQFLWFILIIEFIFFPVSKLGTTPDVRATRIIASWQRCAINLKRSTMGHLWQIVLATRVLSCLSYYLLRRGPILWNSLCIFNIWNLHDLFVSHCRSYAFLSQPQGEFSWINFSICFAISHKRNHWAFSQIY